MKKVMLVDDNMINNFVHKRVIGNVDEQLQVCDYTDAKLALSMVEEIKPTVIFLDLNMPIMNGWQFLEDMANRKMSYQVYILTSSTSELDRQRSTNYPNVVRYLIKPLGQEIVAGILQTTTIYSDKMDLELAS